MCNAPLEGKATIIQTLPTLGLLLVRKTGNNVDIRKINLARNAAPDKRAIEAATRLKGRRGVLYTLR